MISLNYFAQTFQCIMNPSNTPLFAGCSTQFITSKQYGRPEVSVYLATSPRIFSWISHRPCSIHLKNRVSSFDKGTAAQLAMWQPICMSEWSHCRLLLPKVCAGWSYQPWWSSGSTPSIYTSAEMLCCGKEAWNGRQPGQCYTRCQKSDSPKTCGCGSRN